MPRYYTCPTTLAPTPTPTPQTTKTSKRIAPQVSTAKTPDSLEERIQRLEQTIDRLLDRIEQLDDALANNAESTYQLAELLEQAENNSKQDQWRVTQ